MCSSDLLWVRIGTHGAHRLNAAHSIGNDSAYPGKGPGLICDTVSRIFNQPVHAFVRVDFRAFEKLIDDLGGIDVNVERGFYDYLFQDGFPAGLQHLDGRRALAYTRYRYILGPEGDNFARELRQQQVINAIRDRIASRGPEDIIKLINAARSLSSGCQASPMPRSSAVSGKRRSCNVCHSRHLSCEERGSLTLWQQG